MIDEVVMTSNKPYLIRALFEWICDNDCTPYLYINTQVLNLSLPAHLLAENPLVLNLSPSACNDLEFSNQSISFQTRFQGKASDIFIPMAAVIALVAKETGHGMTFEWEEHDEIEATDETETSSDSQQERSKTEKNTSRGQKDNRKKKGKLKIVR